MIHNCERRLRVDSCPFSPMSSVAKIHGISQVAVMILLGCSLAAAQVVRGASIRDSAVYIAPDTTSTKMADLDRGREVIVLETSREWLHVETNLTEEKTLSGWIQAKGVVTSATPNGDKILFGEAVNCEDQASERHGRHGAAQDAMRLYYHLADYFPNSPLAAEAMYRSADIRWQIDKADVMSRPSAKERDPNLRQGMDERYMKEVMKKFPGTKWADLAAFHLIENKLCGEWEGTTKCPEREAELYEKFASEHPQSSVTAEALYQAAWRMSVLIELYKSEEQTKKSDEARNKAIELAQKASELPQTDWAARAEKLLFMIQQGIPTYGNAQE